MLTMREGTLSRRIKRMKIVGYRNSHNIGMEMTCIVFFNILDSETMKVSYLINNMFDEPCYTSKLFIVPFCHQRADRAAEVPDNICYLDADWLNVFH